MEYVRGIAAALRHPHRLDAGPRGDPKYPTMAAGKYKLSFRLGTLPTLKTGAEWMKMNDPAGHTTSRSRGT